MFSLLLIFMMHSNDTWSLRKIGWYPTRCTERVERVERAERIDRLLLVDVLTEDLDVLTEDMPERVDEVDRSRLTRPMDRGVVERPRLTLRRACFTCLLLSRNSILILVKDDLAFFNSFFNFKS